MYIIRKFVKLSDDVIILYVGNCKQKFENDHLTGSYGRFSVKKLHAWILFRHIYGQKEVKMLLTMLCYHVWISGGDMNLGPDVQICALINNHLEVAVIIAAH